MTRPVLFCAAAAGLGYCLGVAGALALSTYLARTDPYTFEEDR